MPQEPTDLRLLGGDIPPCHPWTNQQKTKQVRTACSVSESSIYRECRELSLMAADALGLVRCCFRYMISCRTDALAPDSVQNIFTFIKNKGPSSIVARADRDSRDAIAAPNGRYSHSFSQPHCPPTIQCSNCNHVSHLHDVPEMYGCCKCLAP